jgi:hypothetical protein
MANNKANFLIQKSHLQDGKIQISQFLFAIWMAFLCYSLVKLEDKTHEYMH